jgi:flotillin
VDKITILSTGGGQGLGADRLTADMAKMIAQAPALFETLTGVRVADLMARVPGLGEVLAQPSTNGDNRAKSGEVLAPLEAEAGRGA